MRSEFTVTGRTQSNTTSPVRWVASHMRRYWFYVLGALGGMVVQTLLNSVVPILAGLAFDAILETPPDRDRLMLIAIALLGIVLIRGFLDMGGSLSAEVVAKRLERDARDELYVRLPGKRQTFHNRQSVGDLMARAANDVRQLNMMVNPGLALIIDAFTGLAVPIIVIAFLDVRLLAPPLLFTVVFLFALRHYMRQLNPVSSSMRARFGMLNSDLQESISGIEVIKSTAQESQEEQKFETRATDYRDAMVEQGVIQARYLPTLLLGVMNAGALLLGLYLVTED